jgi:hypothetical protein
MSFSDAANLLLAVGGTGVTREAGTAVKAFRMLEGVSPDELQPPFLDWLSPLGIKEAVKHGMTLPGLETDFGSFIEFLMREATSGRLNEILRSVPVALIDEPTFRRYVLMENSTETLLQDKRVQRMAASHMTVGSGQDVWVELEFNRTIPIAWVHFRRHALRDNETVCSFLFSGPKSVEKGDLKVTAIVSQTTLASLAYCVANGPLPRRVRSTAELENFLFSAPNS